VIKKICNQRQRGRQYHQLAAGVAQNEGHAEIDEEIIEWVVTTVNMPEAGEEDPSFSAGRRCQRIGCLWR
jgi:hypothetical protein